MQGGICAIQEDILRGRNVEHEGRPFSSTENLEATMRKGAWFNLFCLDICMAGKSGMEFAWELRSWDERAGVFFITRWRCCPRPTPRWRLIDAQPHAGVPWTGGQPGQSHYR